MDVLMHFLVQEKLTGADKQAMWRSGEMGGFECYILADEEAAEVSLWRCVVLANLVAIE